MFPWIGRVQIPQEIFQSKKASTQQDTTVLDNSEQSALKQITSQETCQQNSLQVSLAFQPISQQSDLSWRTTMPAVCVETKDRFKTSTIGLETQQLYRVYFSLTQINTSSSIVVRSLQAQLQNSVFNSKPQRQISQGSDLAPLKNEKIYQIQQTRGNYAGYFEFDTVSSLYNVIKRKEGFQAKQLTLKFCIQEQEYNPYQLDNSNNSNDKASQEFKLSNFTFNVPIKFYEKGSSMFGKRMYNLGMPRYCIRSNAMQINFSTVGVTNFYSLNSPMMYRGLSHLKRKSSIQIPAQDQQQLQQQQAPDIEMGLVNNKDSIFFQLQQQLDESNIDQQVSNRRLSISNSNDKTSHLRSKEISQSNKDIRTGSHENDKGLESHLSHQESTFIQENSASKINDNLQQNNQLNGMVPQKSTISAFLNRQFQQSTSMEAEQRQQSADRATPKKMLSLNKLKDLYRRGSSRNQDSIAKSSTNLVDTLNSAGKSKTPISQQNLMKTYGEISKGGSPTEMALGTYLDMMQSKESFTEPRQTYNPSYGSYKQSLTQAPSQALSASMFKDQNENRTKVNDNPDANLHANDEYNMLSSHLLSMDLEQQRDELANPNDLNAHHSQDLNVNSKSEPGGERTFSTNFYHQGSKSGWQTLQNLEDSKNKNSNKEESFKVKLDQAEIERETLKYLQDYDGWGLNTSPSPAPKLQLGNRNYSGSLKTGGILRNAKDTSKNVLNKKIGAKKQNNNRRDALKTVGAPSGKKYLDDPLQSKKLRTQNIGLKTQTLFDGEPPPEDQINKKVEDFLKSIPMDTSQFEDAYGEEQRYRGEDIVNESVGHSQSKQQATRSQSQTSIYSANQIMSQLDTTDSDDQPKQNATVFVKTVQDKNLAGNLRQQFQMQQQQQQQEQQQEPLSNNILSELTDPRFEMQNSPSSSKQNHNVENNQPQGIRTVGQTQGIKTFDTTAMDINTRASSINLFTNFPMQQHWTIHQGPDLFSQEQSHTKRSGSGLMQINRKNSKTPDSFNHSGFKQNSFKDKQQKKQLLQTGSSYKTADNSQRQIPQVPIDDAVMYEDYKPNTTPLFGEVELTQKLQQMQQIELAKQGFQDVGRNVQQPVEQPVESKSWHNKGSLGVHDGKNFATKPKVNIGNSRSALMSSDYATQYSNQLHSQPVNYNVGFQELVNSGSASRALFTQYDKQDSMNSQQRMSFKNKFIGSPEKARHDLHNEIHQLQEASYSLAQNSAQQGNLSSGQRGSNTHSHSQNKHQNGVQIDSFSFGKQTIAKSQSFGQTFKSTPDDKNKNKNSTADTTPAFTVMNTPQTVSNTAQSNPQLDPNFEDASQIGSSIQGGLNDVFRNLVQKKNAEALRLSQQRRSRNVKLNIIPQISEGEILNSFMPIQSESPKSYQQSSGLNLTKSVSDLDFDNQSQIKSYRLMPQETDRTGKRSSRRLSRLARSRSLNGSIMGSQIYSDYGTVTSQEPRGFVVDIELENEPQHNGGENSKIRGGDLHITQKSVRKKPANYGGKFKGSQKLQTLYSNIATNQMFHQEVNKNSNISKWPSVQPSSQISYNSIDLSTRKKMQPIKNKLIIRTQSEASSNDDRKDNKDTQIFLNFD